MTAQIHDTIIYQDEDFLITGVHGEGLFDPASEGIEAFGYTTACWRGFYCKYIVKESSLRLHKLTINLGISAKEPLPLLWGQSPQIHYETHYRRKFPFLGKRILVPYATNAHCYTDLTQTIEYSGELLIGTNFIDAMYVHQGFQKAYRFENVHELKFEKGLLVASRDISATMEAFRQEMRRLIEEKGGYTVEDIKKWVEDCYDLDYSTWLKSNWLE